MLCLHFDTSDLHTRFTETEFMKAAVMQNLLSHRPPIYRIYTKVY